MYVFVDKISTEKKSGRVYLAYRVWATQADFDSVASPVYANDHLIDTARLPESDTRFIRDINGNFVLLSGQPMTLAEYAIEVIAYRIGTRITHPNDDLQTETAILNLGDVLKEQIIKQHLEEMVKLDKLKGDSKGKFDDKPPKPGDKAEKHELKSLVGTGFEIAIAGRVR